MTDCNLYFDIRDLDASSAANEVYVTNYCIANRTKLGFFLFWLVFYSLQALVALACLLRECTRGQPFRVHATKKLCFLLIACAAICGVGSQALFLSSNQNPGRYILYAGGSLFVHFADAFVYRALSAAACGLMGYKSDPEHLIRLRWLFNISLFVFDALAVVTHVGVLIVFAAIAYGQGNFVLLNVVYVVWVSLSGIKMLGQVIAFVTFARGIISNSKTDSEMLDTANKNTEVAVFRAKIRAFVPLGFAFIPVLCGFILLPLILLYRGGPMLPGMFYFHFTAGQLYTCLSACCTLFLLLKEARAFGLSSGLGTENKDERGDRSDKGDKGDKSDSRAGRGDRPVSTSPSLSVNPGRGKHGSSDLEIQGDILLRLRPSFPAVSVKPSSADDLNEMAAASV